MIEIRQIEIRRIGYNDPRAVVIREAMDVEMGALYADMNDGRSDEMIANVGAALTVHPEDMIATIGAFDGETLVGHAALRSATIDTPNDSLEVKRVIVLPEARGQGISKRLMSELETVATERGITSMVLQTGPRQIEAITLYEKIGYRLIPNFGLYAAVPFFLCYGKTLSASPER